jgi:hypothetical protein
MPEHLNAYEAVRSSIPDAIPIAVLHVGAEQTAIAVGIDAQPQAVLVMAIGAERTAREYFQHAPPSALELENAIIVVEDAIAPAKSIIPDGAKLYTTDPAVRRIMLFSGIGEAPQMVLSLDALERSFGRLASSALGRPELHEGIPAANEFAATFLILREFMHHMNFQTVTVLALKE